ncbi:hypothetical protein Y032_0007g3175 [Ancylostoma ceylanicum]|uniref:Uncharacterized protein n=1 Tax=Ancylostoma ceylanicum TaxID=53326 RepID=A0A016VL49_9BILA|nr:hypothetical protein Y032_0007g3175 [Ancylostoma ceylanicum]
MRKYFIVVVLASSIIYGHCQVPGGITTQDPNSPEYMMRARKAAKEVSSSGKNLMIPIKTTNCNILDIEPERVVLPKSQIMRAKGKHTLLPNHSFDSAEEGFTKVNDDIY